MMIDYHFVMKRFLNLLYLYQFICMIQGNYGTASELWILKDKSCVTGTIQMMWMLGRWIFGRKDAKDTRPKKTKKMALMKKDIKKEGFWLSQKLAYVTKSKDHGTSIQNAGLEYFCNTYFKLEKELLIRAQYFFDKGSIWHPPES